MTEKHNSLSIILGNFRVSYIPIESETSLDRIYQLFVNKQFTEPENDIEYNYYGLYFQHIDNDYDKTKKYFKLAIEKNNSNAMNNLGLYYELIEKNFVKMEKWYLMAIEHKNSQAMKNLGAYYEHDANTPEKALELYLKNHIEFKKKILSILREKVMLNVFIEKYILLSTENTELKEDVTKLIKDLSELKLTVEHLKYKPGKVGAKQAKEHFDSLL